MPFLFIHLLNAEFESRDEGADYETPESAAAVGVQGAVQILSDEIIQGRPSAAVEVSVIDEDGKRVLRSIVSLSVAQILP